ncbi:MAG: DUF2892 domain-containing protein [Candidatus Undinarchaeales archaeon]|jgi:hypothetical protein|nr:DUF2892 domain-containing protein [Candidatus Undinarchaeales archaeon]MDP7492728.1 DUF2892 domain-containing protein [Candidatus Undinarchaeales archaeon]
MDLRTLLLTENVGGWDLFLRALFGSVAVVALAMDLVPEGTVRGVVGFIAAACLFTSIMRHCTPYVLLDYSTK